MITFSPFCFVSSLISRLSWPLLYFLKSTLGGAGAQSADAVDRQSLRFPAMDSVAQLEEGHGPGWDRHPGGDQAEDQDRREDRFLGQAEEDEGADHPGVHRPHPGGREREEVGDHAEEEALDDDRERDLDAERVERGPEHADVERPEARRADHREAALAR